MASLVEQGLDVIIAQAFQGQLYQGTLRRETPSGLDEFGDPQAPTLQTATFNGIRDSFNARLAASAGIPLTDVRVLLIARSCSLEPRVDDKIFIRSQWHQVRAIIERDPANATFVLQCFEIVAP